MHWWGLQISHFVQVYRWLVDGWGDQVGGSPYYNTEFHYGIVIYAWLQTLKGCGDIIAQIQ